MPGRQWRTTRDRGCRAAPGRFGEQRQRVRKGWLSGFVHQDDNVFTVAFLSRQYSITKPGTATNLSAINNGGRVVVAWTPPLEQGSNATVWKVTASPSGQSCVTVRTMCEFDGLPGGQATNFSVVGTNAFGEGVATQLTAPFVAGLTSRKTGASLTFAAITRLAGLTGKPTISVAPIAKSICGVRGTRVVMSQQGTCVIKLKKGTARHSLSVQVL